MANKIVGLCRPHGKLGNKLQRGKIKKSVQPNLDWTKLQESDVRLFIVSIFKPITIWRKVSRQQSFDSKFPRNNHSNKA